jgi:hypothetical protein
MEFKFWLNYGYENDKNTFLKILIKFFGYMQSTKIKFILIWLFGYIYSTKKIASIWLVFGKKIVI